MLNLILHLWAAAPPATQPTSTWLYVLGAAFAGGALTTAFQVYQRFRRGPLEDKELISRISRSANEDLKDMLGEYRIELEVVKKQVEGYRQQLYTMTQELAKATVRISQLEAKLETAGEDRERLREELRKAIEERVQLQVEIARLEHELERLEAT